MLLAVIGIKYLTVPAPKSVDRITSVCVECYTVIYFVEKCEIDHPTMLYDVYSEGHVAKKC